MKDAISYTITIEATVERVEKAGKEWQRVDASDGAKYAYTPEIEKTTQRRMDVYRQVVDNINLAAVIKAVNNVG